MKEYFRLIRRRCGTYWVQNLETGHKESLETNIKAEAYRLFHAKNESHYLAGFNSGWRGSTCKRLIRMQLVELGKRSWITLSLRNEVMFRGVGVSR